MTNNTVKTLYAQISAIPVKTNAWYIYFLVSLPTFKSHTSPDFWIANENKHAEGNHYTFLHQIKLHFQAESHAKTYMYHTFIDI